MAERAQHLFDLYDVGAGAPHDPKQFLRLLRKPGVIGSQGRPREFNQTRNLLQKIRGKGRGADTGSDSPIGFGGELARRQRAKTRLGFRATPGREAAIRHQRVADSVPVHLVDRVLHQAALFLLARSPGWEFLGDLAQLLDGKRRVVRKAADLVENHLVVGRRWRQFPDYQSLERLSRQLWRRLVTHFVLFLSLAISRPEIFVALPPSAMGLPAAAGDPSPQTPPAGRRGHPVQTADRPARESGGPDRPT